MDSNKREMINHLMKAVMSLRTVDECEEFFSALCTEEELNRMSRRILIAKMIVEGETYRNILKKTNASNITISRLKMVMSQDDSTLLDVVKRIG